ncbi:serine/threonine-protein kinase [Tsukamurella soli]|uniref:serine/threonine-protein kinase n=1 Tax=Tsukamurella soli TaxID=644556 RepID=UPI00360CDB5C
MSPEVLTGAALDNRTDVYSLGCTAFYLLTGRPPFASDSLADEVFRHLNEPPPSAWQGATNLPPAVDEVFAQVLAKDPGQRYQSCGEFAEALRRAAGRGAARPVTGSDEPRRSQQEDSGDESQGAGGRRYRRQVTSAEAGHVIGGFRVVSRIRENAMAEVFRVQRTPGAPDEVLTVFRAEACRDGGFVSAVVRSAEALAGVAHPNVLAVSAVGWWGDRLWWASEFIDGNDCGMYAGLGPGAWGQVIDVLAGAAAGLGFVWETRGVAHGHLSPAQIVVVPGGGRVPGRGYTAKVGGFGPDGALALTAVVGLGSLDGWPTHLVDWVSFASPEALRGGALGHRADVYSLGCTAMHLLTGAPPFVADRVNDVRNSHIARRPPSARLRASHLPPGVDEVLVRALAKDPSERYPSCTAFVDALQRVGARTVPDPERPTEGVRLPRSGYYVVTFRAVEVGRYTTADTAVAAAKSVIDTEIGAAPDDDTTPTVTWHAGPRRGRRKYRSTPPRTGAMRSNGGMLPRPPVVLRPRRIRCRTRHCHRPRCTVLRR